MAAQSEQGDGRKDTGGRAVILYDADCGLCRWVLDRVLEWDQKERLRPVALQSEEADRLLDGMPDQERMASWHLATPDGMIYSAGAAIGPLADLLPAGTPVKRLASMMPGLTEHAYRWVARHRGWLGSKLGSESCDADPPSRRRSSHSG